MNLLLASGLSVRSPNSYSRQLTLLGKHLGERGHRITIAGVARSGDAPSQALPREENVADVRSWDTSIITRLRRGLDLDAIVLIGYPDQFPFLKGSTDSLGTYFWYQCSRPPMPGDTGGFVAVPLTKTTEVFLRRAGQSPIGPVIPHAVDTRIFTPPESRRRPSDSPVLLSVGANSHRKRFDLLLRTFCEIRNKIGDARLIIKTDARHKNGGFDLEALAHEFGVAPYLEIIDLKLEDVRLADLYRSASLYLHTSEWEGFGIPVIEAMACGLPVITHAVQGPGELLPYPELVIKEVDVVDESGTLLKAVRPDAAAARAIGLLADDRGYLAVSRLGRMAAVERYDARVVAHCWEELLIDQG